MWLLRTLWLAWWLRAIGVWMRLRYCDGRLVGIGMVCGRTLLGRVGGRLWCLPLTEVWFGLLKFLWRWGASISGCGGWMMALCDYRVGIGASSEQWRRWAEAPSPLRGGLDVSRAESDCWFPVGPSRLVDVAGDPRRRVDVPVRVLRADPWSEAAPGAVWRPVAGEALLCRRPAFRSVSPEFDVMEAG